MALLLRQSGLEAKVSEDILRDVWRKAAINAAVNPITALVRRTNGCIAQDEGLRKLSWDLFEEAVEVGIWWKALRPGDVCFDDVMTVVSKTADNRSSMLQDVERGKRTEIESINGAICRLAPAEDAVRANMTVTALVQAMEGRHDA
jgi:2-dehydropantoate 2-reductase